MLEGAFHPSGNKTVAELTSALLIQANIGNIYKITDSGVTDANWVGGAGQTITANQMAVVVYGNEPNTFLFNLENGINIDMSAYQTKAITPIEVDGVTKNNVEDAVDAINVLAGSNKSDISGIKDGQSIDSFGDVETTLADKADKVSGATNGDFAGLDANGNLTDSGKKASDFGTADEIADIVNVYGSKNLCIYPFYHTTRTVNGITFTDNGDGTVTATGTATGNAIFNVSIRLEDGKLILPNGEYKVNGCPSGGSTDSYWMVMSRTSGGTSENYGNDTGNGMTATLDGDDFSQDNVHFQIAIVIKSGYEIATPLVFKPMVRLASIKDDTYVPYAMNNQELTKKANNTFYGHKATWDALSTAEKIKYEYAEFDDDETGADLVKIQKYEGQITWQSTSNPFFGLTLSDIGISGYKIINVMAVVVGTGGSFGLVNPQPLDDTSIWCDFRLLTTPSTTTQNTYRVWVVYGKA